MPASPSSDTPAPAFLAALYHDPAPVGGVAVALMLGTTGLFGLSVDLPLLVAGFCGATLAYLTDRVWTRAPEDQINCPGRVHWVRAHSGWLAAETAVLFALGGAMLLCLDWSTLLWTGALGAVAVLRVLPYGSSRLARGGLQKPMAIAGAWAAGGTLLPLVEAGHPLGLGAVLFLGYRWLFILPNLLLADWGDRAGDAAAGLAPWAAGWTGRRVRWGATGLLLVAAVGAAAWAVAGSRPVLVGVDALGLLLMMGVVWGLDPTRARDAFLADLVVGWPLVSALAAWMIV